MDVTNVVAGNILYFNMSNLDINSPISLLVHHQQWIKEYLNDDPIYPQGLLDKAWPAQWNDTIKMFQVEFYLPRNSRQGPMSYALFFNRKQWVLNSALGSNASFNVISESKLKFLFIYFY